MKNTFNKYPFNDGREYKKFSFAPSTLIRLEIEAKTGTTHIRGDDPMPRNSTAAQFLIEAAARKCDTKNGEYAYDSTLIKKIRAMDKSELLLAIHGYYDGDLVILA